MTPARIRAEAQKRADQGWEGEAGERLKLAAENARLWLRWSHSAALTHSA